MPRRAAAARPAQWLRWFGRWVSDPCTYVCLYLFVLAAVPQARFVLGGLGVPIYVIDICLLAVYAVFGIQLLRGTSSLRRTRVSIFVVLFIVAMIPGFLRLALEASGYPLEVAYIAGKTLLHTLIFFVITSVVTTRRRLYSALGALATGLVLTSVWGLFESAAFLTDAGKALKQFAGALFDIRPNLITPVKGIRRAAAGFFGPNMLGGFLAMLMPPALFITGAARTMRWRLILGGITACSVFALVATFSRSAWIGAAVGITVGASVCMAIPRWRRFIGVVGVGALLLLVCALAFIPALRGVLNERGAGLVQPWEARNVQLRLESHQRFFRDLAGDPTVLITGVNIRRRDIIERGGDLGKGQNFAFVSNSWLLPLGHAGIGGWLAYIAIYLSVLSVVWYGIRRSASEADTIILSGFGAGLVSVGIVHMLDNYFLEQLFMLGAYLSFIALAVSASWLLVPRADTSRS